MFMTWTVSQLVQAFRLLRYLCSHRMTSMHTASQAGTHRGNFGVSHAEFRVILLHYLPSVQDSQVFYLNSSLSNVVLHTEYMANCALQACFAIDVCILLEGIGTWLIMPLVVFLLWLIYRVGE